MPCVLFIFLNRLFSQWASVENVIVESMINDFKCYQIDHWESCVYLLLRVLLIFAGSRKLNFVFSFDVAYMMLMIVVAFWFRVFCEYSRFVMASLLYQVVFFLSCYGNKLFKHIHISLYHRKENREMLKDGNVFIYTITLGPARTLLRWRTFSMEISQ